MSTEPLTLIDAADSPDEVVGRRYRAIQGLAVSSFVLGVLSIVVVLSKWFGVIPAAGITLGWLAMRQIRRNPEETAGTDFARWGMGLSIGFWVIGSGWHVYEYYNEVPPGYQKISYKTLQPASDEKEFRIPSAAEDLDQQKVFIQGFMFRARKQTNLKEFVLVDDRGACSFCAAQAESDPADPSETQGRPKHRLHDFPRRHRWRILRPQGPQEKGMGGLVYLIEADFLR